MSRVCVVVEYCDDHDEGIGSYQENKAVCGNPTIAENYIERLRMNLIKETLEEGGIATEIIKVGDYTRVMAEFHNGFITYRREYWWTIEQHDILES